MSINKGKKELETKLKEILHLEISDWDCLKDRLGHIDEIRESLINIDKNEKFKMVNKVFKALNSPVRVKMLIAIIKGVSCPCELEYITGLAQATISHHLALLDEAGLIIRERRGKWTTIKPGNYHFLENYFSSF